jgi:hypothetical protein
MIDNKKTFLVVPETDVLRNFNHVRLLTVKASLATFNLFGGGFLFWITDINFYPKGSNSTPTKMEYKRIRVNFADVIWRAQSAGSASRNQRPQTAKLQGQT